MYAQLNPPLAKFPKCARPLATQPDSRGSAMEGKSEGKVTVQFIHLHLFIIQQTPMTMQKHCPYRKGPEVQASRGTHLWVPRPARKPDGLMASGVCQKRRPGLAVAHGPSPCPPSGQLLPSSFPTLCCQEQSPSLITVNTPQERNQC